MDNPKKQEPLKTADEIHNHNCYDYFHQLLRFINNQVIELLPEFAQLQFIMNQDYDPNIPYGDLYSQCISALEEYIDKTLSTPSLDKLILALYHNDNHILERDDYWLTHTGEYVSPRNSAGKEIKQVVKDDAKKKNQHSPCDKSHTHHKVSSLFASNFKPQHETNLPSIKNYSYKKPNDPTEYRFCTQGQRHKGHVRISPLFERWLTLSARDSDSEQKINHIYFNNLALDKRRLNLFARKERAPSLVLHQLEEKSQLKILVITLPANNGLMNYSDYKKTNKSLSAHSVFQELLDVAKGKPHYSGISDFNMSQKTRKLLFSSLEHEEKQLTKLLKQSFKAHGIHMDMENPKSITPAQRQAVWVHFVKYELTQYLLQTIKPKSYNFSCKSAIDRGALSSTYYNLHRSFALNKPIGKTEFERSIDIAAVNASGRGMNFHRKILWNAINSYVNANYNELFLDQKKTWLIYWRDMNCPYSQVDDLISLRLNQVSQQFHELPQEKALIKKHGLNLLSQMNILDQKPMRDKQLLLEVISRTSALIQAPSEQSIKAYEQLSTELKTNHVSFTIISGLMELLLGLILYAPTLGHSEKMIRQGCISAGFFSSERKNLSQHMEQVTAPAANNF